jgi:hypothetical protein
MTGCAIRVSRKSRILAIVRATGSRRVAGLGTGSGWPASTAALEPGRLLDRHRDERKMHLIDTMNARLDRVWPDGLHEH